MNQNPEQVARDQINKQPTACGWIIQNKNQINLKAGLGMAVREYQTDIGPADYTLFVDRKPVGVIEAKRPEERIHLTFHEDQTEGYADPDELALIIVENLEAGLESFRAIIEELKK